MIPATLVSNGFVDDIDGLMRDEVSEDDGPAQGSAELVREMPI